MQPRDPRQDLGGTEGPQRPIDASPARPEDQTKAAAIAAGTGGQATGGFRSRLNRDTQESEASQMSPETRAKIAAAHKGRSGP